MSCSGSGEIVLFFTFYIVLCITRCCASQGAVHHKVLCITRCCASQGAVHHKVLCIKGCFKYRSKQGEIPIFYKWDLILRLQGHLPVQQAIFGFDPKDSLYTSVDFINSNFP